jgi:hypothetical protein
MIFIFAPFLSLLICTALVLILGLCWLSVSLLCPVLLILAVCICPILMFKLVGKFIFFLIRPFTSSHVPTKCDRYPHTCCQHPEHSTNQR